MKEVYLKKPELKDLWFRAQCMSDPDTMSYNAGYEVSYEGYHYNTGCIDFPEEKWERWFDEKMSNPGLYYAYIVDSETDEYVGYVNYNKRDEGLYSMGIVIYSLFRGKGYMRPALIKLIEHARKNGVRQLWDSVPLSRENALKVFYSLGFEAKEEFISTRFNKDDKCVYICYDMDKLDKKED